MLTVQGDAEFDIYLGKVRIDGQDFDIPVYVGEGVPEVLLGRQWLRDFQEINYPNKRTTPDAENTERREVERIFASFWDIFLFVSP